MLCHKSTYKPPYLKNCDMERALEANMTQLHNRELEGRIVNDFYGFLFVLNQSSVSFSYLFSRKQSIFPCFILH